MSIKNSDTAINHFDGGNKVKINIGLKPGVYFATVNNLAQIKFIVL